MNTELKQVILHIEDRDEDIVLVRRVLEREFKGITVTSISDAEEALQKIKNRTLSKRMPSAILLDIKMPKISGLELLEELRKDKDYNRLPVIMFSSSTQEVDIQKAYDFGANSFVEKPQDYSSLKDKLVNLVRYWVDLNLN